MTKTNTIKKAGNNLHIQNLGKILDAEKLPVLTITLGKVKDLTPYSEVVSKDADGNIRIVTKESGKKGTVYPQDNIAVLRIIGGKLLMNGYYDIYSMSEENCNTKFKDEISLEDTLDENLLNHLEDILKISSNTKAYLSEKEDRKVIVVSEDTYCYNEWDMETPCKMNKGDIFNITNLDSMMGYRIGKDEASETLKIFED